MNRFDLHHVVGLLCTGILLIPGVSPAQLPTDLYLANTNPDVKIIGATPLHQTAYGFATGDFNGDGHPDLAVLSRGKDAADGYAFVSILWGPPPLPAMNDLANYPSVSVIRASQGEMGWLARIAAGNFNGDNVDDIALGIPCRFPYGNCDGKVYLIFGRTAFPDTLDLGPITLGVTTLAGRPGIDGALGAMLVVNDLNRDGMDDLVASAPLSIAGSEVYVLWGTSSFPPQILMASGSGAFTRIIDSRGYQSSGEGVACGDVNGDSWPDLLIGSPGQGQDNGEATLLPGFGAFPDTILIAIQPPGSKRFLGAGAYDQTGYRVAITDMNGDGYGDMVLSSYTAGPDGCEACGEVDVVLGGSSLPSTTVLGSPELTMLRLISAGTGTSLGVEMATGDANGDGFGDVLVMSKQDLYDPSDNGSVIVVYGSYSLPDSIHVMTDPTVTRIHGENRDEYLGRGLSAFDMSGDGVDDLILGAPGSSPLGRNQAGTAYIIYGPAWSTGVRSARALFLGQNHPNPFNPVTSIPVSLAVHGPVVLRVYDVRGERVRTLLDRDLDAGGHEIPWDGTDDEGNPVASGVYFCRFSGISFTAVRKMVLLR